jgi:hypothetical protein
MAPERSKADPEYAERWWIGFGKFLLLLMFVALVFWLVQSMVRHRFFSGGSLNNRGAVVEPLRDAKAMLGNT